MTNENETMKTNGTAVRADDALLLTPAQREFFRERVRVMQDMNAQIQGGISLLCKERSLPGNYGLSDDQSRLVLQQQQAAPQPQEQAALQ